MTGPCEHCGNADKSKWTTQCLYKGDYPSRRAFVLSTFDAPCSFDAYDENMTRLHSHHTRQNLLLVAAVVAIVVAISLSFAGFF